MMAVIAEVGGWVGHGAAADPPPCAASYAPPSAPQMIDGEQLTLDQVQQINAAQSADEP